MQIPENETKQLFWENAEPATTRLSVSIQEDCKRERGGFSFLCLFWAMVSCVTCEGIRYVRVLDTLFL